MHAVSLLVLSETYIIMCQISERRIVRALVKEGQHTVEVNRRRFSGLLDEEWGELAQVKVVQPTEGVASQGHQATKEEQNVFDNVEQRLTQSGLQW